MSKSLARHYYTVESCGKVHSLRYKAYKKLESMNYTKESLDA